MYREDVSYPFVFQPNQVDVISIDLVDKTQTTLDIECYGFDLCYMADDKAYTMKPYYERNFGINRKIWNVLFEYIFVFTGMLYWTSRTEDYNDSESYVSSSSFTIINGNGRLRKWEQEDGNWFESGSGFTYDANGKKLMRDNMGIYVNDPETVLVTFPSYIIDDMINYNDYNTISGISGIPGYKGYPEKYLESFSINGFV